MAPVRRHESLRLRIARDVLCGGSVLRLSLAPRVMVVLCLALAVCSPRLRAQNPAAPPQNGPGGQPESIAPLPATSQPTAAPTERVVDIVIVGNNEIKRDKVLNNIGTRVGRPFDQTLYEADVRKLSSRNWFVHVRPKVDHVAGGVVVTFEVIERPTVQYLKFLGWHKIKERTLVKESGLKKGAPLDPYAVQDGARKIESLYQGKGYNDVKVTVLEGSKPGDKGVTYLINEGRVQKFSTIKFVGNDPNVAPDGRLKTIVQSKKPILWMFKGQVDRKKIEEDVEKLELYYRGLGFFKAHVSRSYEFNEREDKMTLTFHIIEGPRYKVRSIAFIGNKIYPEEVLAANLKLKAGQYFDQTRMNNDMGGIKDLYGSHGYVFAEALPEPKFFLEPGELDLVYQVNEGKQFRIGDINVEIKGDNPHTRFATVLNRTSMRPGDIADIRQFRSTERRLKAAGIYNVDPSKGDMPRVVFSPPDGEEEVASTKKRAGGRKTGNPDTFRGQSPDVSTAGAAAPSVAPNSANGPVPFSLGAPVTSATGQVGASQPNNARPGYPTQPRATQQPSGTQAGYQQPANSPAGGRPVGYPQPATAQPVGQPYQPAASQGTLQPPAGAVPSYYSAPATSSPPAGRQEPSILAPTIRGQSPDPYGGYGGKGAGFGAGFGDSSSITAGPKPYAVNQPPADYGVVQPGTQPYGVTQPAYGTPQPSVQGAPAGAPQGSVIEGLTPPPPILGGQPGFLDGQGLSGIDQPAIPVTIVTTEAQTGKFMIGAGVNSNAGLVGNIVIDEQNFDWKRVPTSWEDFRTGRAFRGAGQRFRIEAAPGTVLQRYTFSFSEPFLFDTRVALGLNAFYYNRYFRDWVEQRAGGRTSLGYQFSPDLSGTVALRAEDILISQPRVTGVPDLDDVLRHTQIYSVAGTMAHDTRDSTFLATEGHYIDMTFEYAMGTFQYPRFTFNARKHFLLKERPDGTGRHTLSFYNQFGISGKDTPIYERFYAGGFSSLRGFQFRGASPQIDTVEVGGDFQNLSSVEYMFPITADDMLKGVTFVDFGTVEPNANLFWNDFRIAPGLGLRVTIPMISPAPIALDFAFPVHYAPNDIRQIFSFFVGVGH